MTKSHVICFLFNRNLDHIWLLKQDDDAYPKGMSGIIGTTKPYEAMQDAMLRTLKDKTGLDTVCNLQYIAALSLYNKQAESVISHYFSAVLPDGMEPDTSGCSLISHETEYIINRTPLDRYLADGEMPYLVKLGKERQMPE